jgi:hypothetical protein
MYSIRQLIRKRMLWYGFYNIYFRSLLGCFTTKAEKIPVEPDLGNAGEGTKKDLGELLEKEALFVFILPKFKWD